MDRGVSIIFFVIQLLIALFSISLGVSYFNDTNLGAILGVTYLVVAAFQFILMRTDKVKLRVIGIVLSIIIILVANEIGFRATI